MAATQLARGAMRRMHSSRDDGIVQSRDERDGGGQCSLLSYDTVQGSKKAAPPYRL